MASRKPISLEDLEMLDSGIVSARRILGMISEVCDSDPDDLPSAWVRDARLGLDHLLDALESGENAILRRRAERFRKADREEEKRAERTKRRPPSVEGAATPDLSRDPSRVPGAIRCALAASEQGSMLLGELVDAVNKLRPNTDQPSISSALSAMVKRREIAREGFHKNYRYRLIGVAQSAEQDESSKETPV